MSLLSLLAQQIAQKQAGPQMGQAQGQPLPFSGPPPQLPPLRPPTAQPDATATPQHQAPAPNTASPRPAEHPHWWGRLMLGQGEFAPGSALGTANEMFGPAAGYHAAEALDQGHPGAAALAALPLIPGMGPESKVAMEAVDPAFLGAYEAEKAAAKMAREAQLARPSAVMKAPVEGLTEGAGMEDAAYQRALAKKKPLNSY